MHKTKIYGWLYYPFRVLISNIMECHFRRRVGQFTKTSILASENESARLFPYSILSHFPEISQIYKPIAELPHHALFHFTRFTVKNYDT